MVTKKPISYAMPRFQGSLEKVRSVVENGNIKSVVFVDEDLKARNKAQLDPREMDLTYLLENNMLVSPKDFVKVFNISDPADLESHNDIQNEKALAYLEAHKDELKALVSPVVEPEKKSKL